VICFLIVLDALIGHGPLVYMESWSYLTRKQIHIEITMFSNFLFGLGKTGLAGLRMAFSYNTTNNKAGLAGIQTWLSRFHTQPNIMKATYIRQRHEKASINY